MFNAKTNKQSLTVQKITLIVYIAEHFLKMSEIQKKNDVPFVGENRLFSKVKELQKFIS